VSPGAAPADRVDDVGECDPDGHALTRTRQVPA
jgi:hypothetical protein